MNPHLRIAETLVNLLENRFRILGFKFGLDPILGLIPGGGDMVALLLSLYLIWLAIKFNVPAEKLAQMIGNVIVNFLVGIIPVIGDVGSFFYRSNSYNLKILKQYANENVIEGEEAEIR